MNRVKLTWLRKLSKTKNFVVVTDKEAVVYLPNVNANRFADVQLVSAQLAELYRFREKIDTVIKEYERATSKILGTSQHKKHIKVTRKNSRAVKVPVKKG